MKNRGAVGSICRRRIRRSLVRAEPSAGFCIDRQIRGCGRSKRPIKGSAHRGSDALGGTSRTGGHDAILRAFILHVFPAQGGLAMIDLYYWTTPNGHKVTIFLEEAGLKYNVIPINIGKGEQFKADFLAVAPNNRIPAIVDHEPAGGGKPISVFESGAILVYLADKTGKFIGTDVRARTDVLQWLFWQMGGLGPMAGQNNHFSVYAPEKIPYAIDRYRNEVNRLFGVMNKRLADRDYLGGDYSIADMACYPWVLPWERQGQNIEDFLHLKRWLEAIKARPAVVKAYEWTPKINPGAGGIRTAEERAILFGQTAKSTADAAAGKQ
jgi:GSH-dependent disulfide-bond oxidoreductase